MGHAGPVSFASRFTPQDHEGTYIGKQYISATLESLEALLQCKGDYTRRKSQQSVCFQPPGRSLLELSFAPADVKTYQEERQGG